MLVLGFELLDAGAAVDVVEAEFEDAVIVDAAFAGELGRTARASKVLVFMEPELLLFSGAVLACWEDATEGSALDVGVGVGVWSPELDCVVDAHVDGVMFRGLWRECWIALVLGLCVLVLEDCFEDIVYVDRL